MFIPLEAIGCCGAYCGTCKALLSKDCKGCKLGYGDGSRNLTCAKCKIKICCINKGFVSCADCAEYNTCETIQSFHNHEGYKYGKYKAAIALIKTKGYEAYLETAKNWTNAYGKINDESNKILEVTIELTIRPWRLSDAKSLAEIMNNKNVTCNLRDGIPDPYTQEDAVRYLMMKQDKQDGKSYAFAIALNDQAIGTIGVMRKENVHSHTAEMGYALNEKYWGKGYMSKAVRLTCEYIFKHTDMIRIFAEPYANNHASCRVLEKVGFVYEGTMRKNAVKNGKVLDMKLYAMIKE